MPRSLPCLRQAGFDNKKQFQLNASWACPEVIYCITTTNTLYFWSDKELTIQELKRVLKPEGKLLIGYRSRNCMSQLKVTKYNFEIYDAHGVEDLLNQAGLSEVHTEVIKEPTLEFDGKVFDMDGLYTKGIK